jgi:RHS repeat-associated protein
MAQSAYNRNRGNIVWPAWHGSLRRNKLNTTGHEYHRNRVYDPQSGRFTQEDPIGLAGGLNGYGFANGDPVNFSDPFGLCPACLRMSLKALDRANAISQLRALEQPTLQLLVEMGKYGVFALAAEASLATDVAGIRGAGGGTTMVTHFTSREGAAAIEASGAIRAGSYVTEPGAVAGLQASAVEGALEIQAGRGAMSATFSVATDMLRPAPNGPVTSGGAVQHTLGKAVPVKPGTFKPTP